VALAALGTTQLNTSRCADLETVVAERRCSPIQERRSETERLERPGRGEPTAPCAPRPRAEGPRRLRCAEAVPRLLALVIGRGGRFRRVVPSQRRRCSPDCRRWQHPFVRPSKLVAGASSWRDWPSWEVLCDEEPSRWSEFQAKSAVPSRVGRPSTRISATGRVREVAATLEAVRERTRCHDVAVVRSSQRPPRKADHYTAAA
jgi:hypothetical protein